MDTGNSLLWGAIFFVPSIILAYLFWRYSAADFMRFIKRHNLFKEINRENIIKLEDIHLTVENKEFLNDTKASKKFKYVFWPVTPTDSPNLIHLLSLFYLTKLSKSGLIIIVFVFDSYYEMIKNKSRKVVKQEVLKFQNDLKNMGLKNCNYRIEKESNYVNSQQLNNEGFASRFYVYMSSLQYGELMKLKKPYIEENTPSIRFFKSILNMMYLKLVPYRIGFTFSGHDEKTLWEIFSRNPVDGQDMRLTNFYLPTLPKLSIGQTDVLDKSTNITIDDSVNDIYNKIVTHQQCLENNGLVNILLEVFLKTGETISIQVNDTDFRTYFRFEQIKVDLQNSVLKEKILRSISQKIYGLFHQ